MKVMRLEGPLGSVKSGVRRDPRILWGVKSPYLIGNRHSRCGHCAARDDDLEVYASVRPQIFPPTGRELSLDTAGDRLQPQFRVSVAVGNERQLLPVR